METNGFKKFMGIIGSKYVVPSRCTVTRKLTDSLQSVRNAIRNELTVVVAGGSQIHATIDLRSSKKIEPINDVCFH